MAYWEQVKRIVESRGRELKRYKFFEKTWKALDDGANSVILKAPTGCGKTEAITVPFMAQMVEGKPPWVSLIYVMPTRSLVHSMRVRLAGSLEALGAQRATVTLDHGEFYSTKPYLEGDVAITTYDTLLYTTYGFRSPGYHILLPAGKVALSLVVMDEVQLLQDTTWFTMEVLPWHIRCFLELGAQVAVMTATMPPPFEDMFTRCCKDWRVKTIVAEDRPDRGRIEVIAKREPLPTDEKGLKEILSEVLNDDGLPLLIVVNKVSKAVEIYERICDIAREGFLPENVDISLLHSRLRRGLRDRVETTLEKNRGDRPLILIATQVIEAGLDYDFRTLVTEICPVDSLVQRVGRIARRPDTSGEAFIFLDGNATEGVYPRQVIERSLEIVKDCELVAEATRSICAASELLKEVYTRDLVEELIKNAQVKKLITKIRGFAEEFVNILAFGRFAIQIKDHLLRLGVELKCWVPRSEQEAERLLNGEEICISHEELRSNLVSISVAKTPGEHLKVPSAIAHEREGKSVIVVIDMRKEKGGKLVLHGKVEDAKPDKPPWLIASEQPLLLLNPNYYEVRGGVEVGVVRPW